MRVLLSCWAGMGNLGDDWLLEAAVEQLAGYELGLLLEPGAAVGAMAVGDAGSRVLRWPTLRPGGVSPAEVHAFRRALRAWDAVVFCGGGWLAGDQGAPHTARWAARLRLVPVPLAAHGIGAGPFVGTGTRMLAGTVARRLRPVTVRTDHDRHGLRGLGVDAPVVGDPAAARSLPAPTGPGKGVVVAVPRPAEHWLPRPQHEAYAEAVVRLAHRLADGEPVRAVSFQGGPASDAAFWQAHLPAVAPATSAEALEVVAGGRVVVAGRFHAALAAALLDKPAVHVRYHHKFSALDRCGAVTVTPAMLAGGSRLDHVTPPAAPPSGERLRADAADAWSGFVTALAARVGERVPS